MNPYHAGRASIGMSERPKNRRAQRSAQAILAAAQEIMVTEGPDAVTYQRVAEVSGVGRATVYRHWHSIDDLLMAVFEQFPYPALELDETGTFRERIHRMLSWIGHTYMVPRIKPMALAVAERSHYDERMRAIRDGIASQVEATLAGAIADAPAELREHLVSEDTSVLVSLLVGPVFFRPLIQNEAIDDWFIDTVIDSIFLKKPV